MALQREELKPRFAKFYDLMKFRVKEILLVSSEYDAFVLEEDGALSDRIFSEYVGIGLSIQYIPHITRVSTPEDALDELTQKDYDLVITMTRLSGMNLMEFGQKVKALIPEIPVILLTYEWLDSAFLLRLQELKSVDKVFYWAGNSQILLAIIKYIEDLNNVDNDIKYGVQVILLIEDSPKFHSIFLPMLYVELMTQTRSLVSEGVNDLHRLLRMRARPKILMADSYEEGERLYRKYKDKLLGVISDVELPHEGKIDESAGIKFARHVKKEIPDLPFILQSSEMEVREIARQNGLDFLHKYSDQLLHELHEYILSNFGFGDFVFRNCDGIEINRARNIQEFEKKIAEIPEESIIYHAGRNHISIWLRARTEFETAEKLRPVKISDFSNAEEARRYILSEIKTMISRNQIGVITDFGQTEFEYRNAFIRLGRGSLGGKGRGIAYLNSLLESEKLAEKYDTVNIKTPITFVICSEVFEKFISDNHLQDFAIQETNNNVIAMKFLTAKLPEEIVKNLLILLEEIKYPLAVRSSSILEDSQMLPFAGLYSTFMLPNNNPDFKIRLHQLMDAIKLVFASVFYKSPKEYVKNTNFRIEEERMAVIIQQLVGRNYNGKFYPVISGTAQSYNYYPISHLKPEDGVVQLALGLGLLVVEGGSIYRVSPRYPEMNPPYSSAQEFMKKSQSYFYAMDLSDKQLQIVDNNEKFSLSRCTLTEAEEDGSLFFVGSTFSGVDNAIRDTLSIAGPRVVTFANILKYNVFPLPQIISNILDIGTRAFGSHIEMEFAVNLFKDKSIKPEFYLLQIRPMVTGQENVEVTSNDIPAQSVFCRSTHSMGNGVFKGFYDLVFVDPDLFDPAYTRLIAAEVGEINKQLSAEKRNYILIGFGRWGTADPWLGIPVEWHQISNARLIVESNTENFNVDPSLGSHFFHNLTSLGMGYFHIRKVAQDEFIDWQWLKSFTPIKSMKYVKHIRFDVPLTARIDARASRGVILKPGAHV